MYKEVEEPSLIRLGEHVDKRIYEVCKTEFGVYKVPLRTVLIRYKKEIEELKAQLKEKESPNLVKIGQLEAYISELEEKNEKLESRLLSVKEENKKLISGIKNEEMYKKLMKDKEDAIKHSHQCTREIGRFLVELNKKDREIEELRDKLKRYERGMI